MSARRVPTERELDVLRRAGVIVCEITPDGLSGPQTGGDLALAVSFAVSYENGPALGFDRLAEACSHVASNLLDGHDDEVPDARALGVARDAMALGAEALALYIDHRGAQIAADDERGDAGRDS